MVRADFDDLHTVFVQNEHLSLWQPNTAEQSSVCPLWIRQHLSHPTRAVLSATFAAHAVLGCAISLVTSSNAGST